MHYTRTFGLYTDTFFFILLYTRTRVILNAWPYLLTDLIKFWNIEISEDGNFRTWKFWNMEILEHGNFVTWKFRNMES